MRHQMEAEREKRAKTVKAFLGERHIQSMSWPANSPDLNSIKNLWWRLKKMVHKKAPTCKADLATAIKEIWGSPGKEGFPLLHHK
uniref:Tc1-like transposase DDE domain-containing protein n=1 Tax=Kryptolebias marmoratus TaxID=37003 RepID=A0A3Q3AFG1_KRYMA